MTRLELATFSLGSWRSTTELQPQIFKIAKINITANLSIFHWFNLLFPEFLFRNVSEYSWIGCLPIDQCYIDCFADFINSFRSNSGPVGTSMNYWNSGKVTLFCFLNTVNRNIWVNIIYWVIEKPFSLFFVTASYHPPPSSIPA